jgi:hypothetical protein
MLIIAVRTSNLTIFLCDLNPFQVFLSYFRYINFDPSFAVNITLKSVISKITDSSVFMQDIIILEY